jgi:Mor family transcriptional regulator
MARLTDKQRNELYQLWLTGQFTIYHLGQQYGISQATVSNILSKFLKQKQQQNEQH